MTAVGNDFQTEWLEGVSPERRKAEAELLGKGLILPLRARCDWAEEFPNSRSTLLIVRNASGVQGALAFERHSSRALPGHQVLRAWHAGATLPNGTASAAIREFAGMVRNNRRVLRAHVEAYARDAVTRAHFTSILSDHGFDRIAPTNYDTTLLTDLASSDDETHFKSLSQGVRQNIRAIAKFPIEKRRITEPELCHRMNALLRETLSRTGAVHTDIDFVPIIRLSLAHPELSNLVGLYRTDLAGPESLIAYAWGVNQGDSVAYDIGASGRVPEFRNLSLGYPLVWDLIVWARALGAPFFDFGGVTAGSSESEDRLGRISDFKRRFSKDVVEVAEEWVLAPHRIRDSLAKAIGKAAELAARTGSWRGQKEPTPG